ncbi:MAG: hypothetical protein A2V88_07770 [Elusimicrobia bacterium RBG_16_66_12]|nr:MAG: hypothetical protein A2V88_07770 [Elusimicrobia bacterium RBG_16_66_12]
MKPFLIAAVLVLASSPLRANPEADAVASDVAGRGEFLQEMEAWRATHLEQATERVFWVYSPRLKDIRERVEAASEEEALVEPKKDFEAWKAALLREKYAEVRAAGMAGRSDFSSYRREQNLSVEMTARIQQAKLDASRAFDGAAAFGGADAMDAPSPLALDNPARYAKLRGIMISQGVKPKIVDAAIKEALRQGVDPALVLTVIWKESRFRPGATSPVGAIGLMQVMPETGRDMGVADAGRLYDVQTNLRAGIKYLRYAARYLRLNVSLADVTEVPAHKIRALLASYNAGIGAVSKWLKRQGHELVRIPYAETRHYVKAIGDKLASLVESSL